MLRGGRGGFRSGGVVGLGGEGEGPLGEEAVARAAREHARGRELREERRDDRVRERARRAVGALERRAREGDARDGGRRRRRLLAARRVVVVVVVVVGRRRVDRRLEVVERVARRARLGGPVGPRGVGVVGGGDGLDDVGLGLGLLLALGRVRARVRRRPRPAASPRARPRTRPRPRPRRAAA